MNALANSNDEYVVCHPRTISGTIEQYGISTMTAAEASRDGCHTIEEGYSGSAAFRYHGIGGNNHAVRSQGKSGRKTSYLVKW